MGKREGGRWRKREREGRAGGISKIVLTAARHRLRRLGLTRLVSCMHKVRSSAEVGRQRGESAAVVVCFVPPRRRRASFSSLAFFKRLHDARHHHHHQKPPLPTLAQALKGRDGKGLGAAAPRLWRVWGWGAGGGVIEGGFRLYDNIYVAACGWSEGGWKGGVGKPSLPGIQEPENAVLCV